MQIILDNISVISPIPILVAMSVTIRMLLQNVGQVWIVTIAHTATLVLLPILTYIITNVISGNIALSLGMVGALSIVRFRNPVRSPLELSVYFGAITMGISAAVSLNWLFLLMGSVIFATIALISLNVFSQIFFSKPFFVASFSEGNSLSNFEVVAESEIKILEIAEELMNKSTTEGRVSYILASSNFKALKRFESEVKQLPMVLSTQINR
ncbi:DUF4956 domain-containing protein [bacterium]|nr:DUF4956 domain-containing protein [bacterium]